MRAVVLLITGLILSGCGEPDKYPKYETDQAQRQRIFKECMAALPEGPRSTTYSDWDEVVSACDHIALRQAKYCFENCAPARKPTDG